MLPCACIYKNFNAPCALILRISVPKTIVFGNFLIHKQTMNLNRIFAPQSFQPPLPNSFSNFQRSLSTELFTMNDWIFSTPRKNGGGFAAGAIKSSFTVKRARNGWTFNVDFLGNGSTYDSNPFSESSILFSVPLASVIRRDETSRFSISGTRHRVNLGCATSRSQRMPEVNTFLREKPWGINFTPNGKHDRAALITRDIYHWPPRVRLSSDTRGAESFTEIYSARLRSRLDSAVGQTRCEALGKWVFTCQPTVSFSVELYSIGKVEFMETSFG